MKVIQFKSGGEVKSVNLNKLSKWSVYYNPDYVILKTYEYDQEYYHILRNNSQGPYLHSETLEHICKTLRKAINSVVVSNHPKVLEILISDDECTILGLLSKTQYEEELYIYSVEPDFKLKEHNATVNGSGQGIKEAVFF